MGFNIDAHIYWEERNRIKSCESKGGRGKIKKMQKKFMIKILQEISSKKNQPFFPKLVGMTFRSNWKEMQWKKE